MRPRGPAPKRKRTPAPRVQEPEGPPKLWAPNPGPQAQAFATQADFTFYGGAAGGGKTDLLLGLALTAHRRSILFRREYAQLKAVIERVREIIGEHGRYTVNEKLWRLPEIGRSLDAESAGNGASGHKGPFFDANRRSDHDIAIISPQLMHEARRQGILARSMQTQRTFPLSDRDLKKLGLFDLMLAVRAKTGRQYTTIMIYETEEALRSRGTYLAIE